VGGETVVVRRGEHGWQVGDEQTADLTSAMVLADLLAADLGTPAVPVTGPPGGRRSLQVIIHMLWITMG
jgi:hypothetical protein